MKFLFVGLGSAGQRHLRNLVALLGGATDILAFRSGATPKATIHGESLPNGITLEDHYGIRVFHDLDEALSESPTAVFITNPTAFHMCVALKAVEAGCHLFIEKPVSDSLDSVENLLMRVRDSNLVAMVGYQFRFHPCLVEIKQLLEAGVIGKPLLASLEVGEYLPSWHPYEDYRDGYSARKDLGGGVVLTQSHEIDLALWWFGMPHKIYALGGRWSSLEIDVEDSASILMKHSPGGVDLAVHLQMDYHQTPPLRYYKVVGEGGRIATNPLEGWMTLETPRGGIRTSRIEGFQRNGLYLDQMRTFLRCLLGEEAPPVSLEEGVRSLRVALAIRRSLQQEKETDLGE